MDIEEDAIKTYDELREKNPLFPNRYCKIAAIAMHKIGYGIIQGDVYVNNYCGLNMKGDLPHYWNYDPNSKKQVDITSEQFNMHLLESDKLPKIFIWNLEEKPKIYEEIRRNLKAYEVI